MNVQIQHLEPLRVAYLRHVGPYMEVGPTWARLLPQLEQGGWLNAQSRCLGIGHDNPNVVPAKDLRYDACVTVEAAFQPAGEVGVQTVAGGDYAVCRHVGPYEGLGVTYSWLFSEWLPQNGRQMGDAPPFEVYVNSPDAVPPAELITDIHIPLA